MDESGGGVTMILAGDIGGTHTRLALFDLERGQLKSVVMDVFPSQEYKSLDLIVRKFIEVHKLTIEYACFGVAGPVKLGHSETSNLAWVVDAAQLSGEFGIKNVELINELEASAYGIALLEPKDFIVLNEGTADANGNMALISAG